MAAPSAPLVEAEPEVIEVEEEEESRVAAPSSPLVEAEPEVIEVEEEEESK